MIEKAGLWWNGGNTGTSTLTIVTTTRTHLDEIAETISSGSHNRRTHPREVL